MKIAYVAKSNIPSTSANSIHVMKISECFEELTDSFELIVPEVPDKRNDQEIFDFYGVENGFPISRIKKKDWKGWYNYYFAVCAIRRILKTKCDAVITRDPLVAFLCVIYRIHVVLDLHGDLRHLCGRSYRFIKWKKICKSKYFHLVMITHALKRYYHDIYGIDQNRITVLPDGYTNRNFEKSDSDNVLKEERIKIGYCGGFLVGKGLSLIQQIAAKDAQNIYRLYGGRRESAEKEIGSVFSANVTFGGYIPNSQIPDILDQQDILLLPNQKQLVCKNEDIGKVTSPLKMFEYMASGKVIIASDLPVLREILNENNCYFANPENVNDWIEKIKYISDHRDEAKGKAKKAQEDVKEYTWYKRAEKMLQLVENKE